MAEETIFGMPPGTFTGLLVFILGAAQAVTAFMTYRWAKRDAETWDRIDEKLRALNDKMPTPPARCLAYAIFVRIEVREYVPVMSEHQPIDQGAKMEVLLQYIGEKFTTEREATNRVNYLNRCRGSNYRFEQQYRLFVGDKIV